MEEIIRDTDTLVIVGAWNRAILSQEWVMHNLLVGYQNVKIEYPLNVLGSLKFSTDDFTFFILGERLTFKALNNKEQTYRTIIYIARQLLRLLSHTPINAMGINFVFKSDKIAAIFDSILDTKVLTQTIEHEISSQDLTRSFNLGESLILNLKFHTDNSISLIDFNFNYDVQKPLDVINILGDSDDIIIEKEKYSLTILEKLRSTE